MKLVIGDSKTLWDKALADFPANMQDIYFTHSWHAMFAADTKGVPYVFLYEENEGRLLYPFLLYEIPYKIGADTIYVCESAYGYGGPIACGLSLESLKQAEETFCSWARSYGIVAEFIRFHPLIENHNIFKTDILVETNRETVQLNLDIPFEKLTAGFSPAKRRNIKKAIHYGLHVEVGNDFSGFWQLYENTMRRRSALPFYFFSEEHRSILEKIVATDGFLLEAHLGGSLVAASIFLIGAGNLHYHLGASDPSFWFAAPNDAIMAKAIHIAVKMGLKRAHLGGGATTDPSDSLLRYKSGFSPLRAVFRTGKRIHNKTLHEELKRVQKDRGNDTETRLFISYLPRG